ncbi:TadE family protein [Pseudactinotalea sp. Z1739]|uniref:TadE family protein n=1 Tax=Pseudactinotalea sp. Z1739 TaxID=3413028 RepID=UPI003C7DF2CB
MDVGGQRDRGASAVEFALVVPLLFALVLGIMAFGQAYHVQSALSGAARDAVRIVALDQGDAPANARAAAIASASPSVALDPSHITIDPSCEGAGSSGRTATVTIRYQMNLLLFGDIGGPITLTGKGTMRCNG